jgi:hypothetical protein
MIVVLFKLLSIINFNEEEEKHTKKKEEKKKRKSSIFFIIKLATRPFRG